MARTSGHGNPDWTRDETLLALDLYFRLGGQIPSGKDARVRELSGLLQRMPYHAEAAKVASFRNPDGVAFKLQNLRQVATGKGLGNTSKTDRAVWQEFGSKPEEVRRLAEAITVGMGQLRADATANDDVDEFREGRILTELHKRRERNKALRKRLLTRRAAEGLKCDLCSLHRPELDKSLQEALFEAHHLVPLSSTEERVTRLADVALLCACCHRLLHCLIQVRGEWLDLAQAKAAIAQPIS
jgi:5-methylcytosine-specific restriction protein A